MSDDIIIRVEGLGKKYRLGAGGSGERYTALRDVIARRASAPFRALKSKFGSRNEKTSNGSHEPPSSSTSQPLTTEFWALRHINFEVKRGDVVGIIGRNGAGKSTLLKILSRITEPTTGRVRIKGRVASLLEVGTGFHPELTGRENIYLNGAILGMARAEIKAKFDEIVAFAEIEKFLDTPVKRYSSGMYVRLAFAVAAHLEPEILVVDEVLAVGDAEFQKKCLGKMKDVSHGGRTVLFVSHNIEAILNLCDSGILLKEGSIEVSGDIKNVVSRYLAGGGENSRSRSWRGHERPGDDVIRLAAVRLHNANGETLPSYPVDADIAISMTYDVTREDTAITDQFNVFNEQGHLLFAAHNVMSEHYDSCRACGTYISTAWIPANLLPEGTFYVSAAVISLFPFTVHFNEEQILALVLHEVLTGKTARGRYAGNFPGAIRPLLSWYVRCSSSDGGVSLSTADLPYPDARRI